jgi:ATP-dependent helicase STH1/SNF2
MLIEGDQEDADESSIINDDELNEILARSEEEANLFFQIDKDNARLREKRIAEGGWVSDLMTVEELPEMYRSDEAPRQAQEEVLVGRGHRRRNNVVYDENMTEQDFIRVRSLQFTKFTPLPDHYDLRT